MCLEQSERNGTFYEFTVDEVNKGTIDAMVSSIVTSGLTEVQAKYLAYTVTNSDGTKIAEKQLLAAGEKETVKVRVEFKKNVTASDLPTEAATLNLSFSINYQQADSSAVAVAKPICKRATTLHTEVCNQTSTSYYCSVGGYTTGSTVTYGNLETAGTLTSGDAFDCDVNGDGTYDPATERFYYVSDLDTDSKYAVLIYYNNVSGGEPNNIAKFAYNINSSSNDTVYRGPETAMLQLPTTAQWKNVRLSSTTRNITDEKGTVRVNNFSYSGYATRLLTAQEVNSACGITVGSYKTGELDSCKYLMENTRYTNNSLIYGYWLESVQSSRVIGAWGVFGDERGVGNSAGSIALSLGVRPAIEVLKSKILY